MWEVYCTVAFGLQTGMPLSPMMKYTYGYKKTTILATLSQCRCALSCRWNYLLGSYPPIQCTEGNARNYGGYCFFHRDYRQWTFSFIVLSQDKDSDLNMKGAYLHLLADAMVSFGVVIGGVAMYFTQLCIG
jgi:cobalt-zinc-cadmium efflux system protein